MEEAMSGKKPLRLSHDLSVPPNGVTLDPVLWKQLVGVLLSGRSGLIHCFDKLHMDTPQPFTTVRFKKVAITEGAYIFEIATIVNLVITEIPVNFISLIEPTKPTSKMRKDQVRFRIVMNRQADCSVYFIILDPIQNGVDLKLKSSRK